MLLTLKTYKSHKSLPQNHCITQGATHLHIQQAHHQPPYICVFVTDCAEATFIFYYVCSPFLTASCFFKPSFKKSSTSEGISVDRHTSSSSTFTKVW